MEKIIQMPLNLLWHPKEKPKEDDAPLQEYTWDLIPDGDRPTEEEAIRNCNHEAIISFRSILHIGSLEYKVCKKELESYRKCPRHYNQAERERWIAKEMLLGVQEVKDILRGVDKKTFHNMAIEEAEKSHRELVREVMAEMFPYFDRQKNAA